MNSSTDTVSVRFSVVMVTYARDDIAARAIDQVSQARGGRTDVEFILVDNNPDDKDRSDMLSAFPTHRYIKLGYNKGVSARNDGGLAARGDFILFVDDDAFLNPVGAFDVYEKSFAGNDKLAIVSARHIDHDTGLTPRRSFPHTDKSLPHDKPFKTFRFQGNGFCIRSDVFKSRVGPLPSDFFYGLEEIDYAYQIVQAGYEIMYQPECWVVEHNDPGGRLPHKKVEEMRLTNKYIISYKYIPAFYLPINLILYTAYVVYLNRGKIDAFKSFGAFLKWVRENPGRRTPLSASAQNYIRSVGGAVWK